MVFYRKYRSQTIADLDLTAVRDKLTVLLTGDDFPHALLFTGPKGLGKTSAARIIAKAINCENKTNQSQKSKSSVKDKNTVSLEKQHNFEPCNTCDVCVSITKGSHVDVLEIDAASNRGIDEIRSLRERVKFSPSELKKKVYIIDEVHMLTNEAFNALLKTLEEPPEHVIFILCTTEMDKLPATIISRVFRIQFEKPTIDEVRTSLKRVIDGEGLKIDDEVYENIFHLAGGAFRDAHKILEELAANSQNGHITAEVVEKVFHTATNQNHIDTLIKAVQARDLHASLKEIESLASQGVNFQSITESIVEKLHTELLALAARKKPSNDNLEISEIKLLLDLFNHAFKDIKTSVLPQLPLEIAAVEWCSKGANENTKIKHDKDTSDEKTLDDTPDSSKTPLEQSAEVPPSTVSGSAFTQDNPKDVLYSVIDLIKKDNHTVAGLLRSCKLSSVSADSIRITAPFKFHQDKLQDKITLQILEDSFSEILSRKVSIEVVIAN